MATWLLAVTAILTARAQDPCAPIRAVLPTAFLCEERPALTDEQWTKRVDGGDFGARIELLVARGDGAFRPVALSTPVCNGDEVAFRVSLSRPGYVHILNRGTSGRWQTVFPSEGTPTVRLTAARVPAGTRDGFPVFGPPGREHVLMFFSPSPLSWALREQLERIAAGDAASPGAQGPRAVYLRDLGPATSSAGVAGAGEQVVAFTLTHAERCAALGGVR